MEFALNFLLGQPPRSLESVVHNALFGPNITFAQITEAQTGHYRGIRDLVYVLPVALLLIGLRSIFYRWKIGKSKKPRTEEMKKEKVKKKKRKKKKKNGRK